MSINDHSLKQHQTLKYQNHPIWWVNQLLRRIFYLFLISSWMKNVVVVLRVNTENRYKAHFCKCNMKEIHIKMVSLPHRFHYTILTRRCWFLCRSCWKKDKSAYMWDIGNAIAFLIIRKYTVYWFQCTRYFIKLNQGQQRLIKQNINNNHPFLLTRCRHDMMHGLSIQDNINSSIGHVNIGIIFLCIGNSKWCIYNTQSTSDWLFNTQSKVLRVDQLILENNEKATSNINAPPLITTFSSHTLSYHADVRL